MTETGPAQESVLRRLGRRWVPFAIRLEFARLRRMPLLWLQSRGFARRRAREDGAEGFPHVLTRRSSPLERIPATDRALQKGKERNVSVAVGKLDRIIVEPHQILSYHLAVGRPSRLRGFRTGLELHDGRPRKGIGGGCCQVSNLLYLMALESGMKIVERHRHALDLFPDHQRTVPFGCGATVFYNHADLRFQNPLDAPVLLRLWISSGFLWGEIRSRAKPLWSVDVYESEHRFYREGDAWMRANRIRRRFTAVDGTVLLDQEVAHNRARTLYEPQERR